MPETIINPMDALNAFVNTTQERVKAFDTPKDTPTDEPPVEAADDPRAGITQAAAQHPATRPAAPANDKAAPTDTAPSRP